MKTTRWLKTLSRSAFILALPTMAAVLAACPNDVPPEADPTGPANPAPTNTPGQDSGGGDSGERVVTDENWRGYVELNIDETADPNDSDVNIAAQGIVFDVPQTDEEKAYRKAEFAHHLYRLVNVPKGTCVARGAGEPPFPVGKGKLADVGDVKIQMNDVDILTLMKGQDNMLGYAQGKFPSAPPKEFGLTLKYWVSDLGLSALDFASLNKPVITTTPAADAQNRINMGTNLELLLTFSLPPKAVGKAELSTANPSGPAYTCYAKDDGTVTVPANIIDQFRAAGTGTDFRLEFEQFLTDFWGVANQSDVGTKFDLSIGDVLSTNISWGTTYHFYF